MEKRAPKKAWGQGRGAGEKRNPAVWTTGLNTGRSEPLGLLRTRLYVRQGRGGEAKLDNLQTPMTPLLDAMDMCIDFAED